MQAIKIVNFKALKDVEFKVNDLLLLLGEQASGKSTVSKLIYFFKSIKQDFVDYVYDNLDNEISEESIFARRFWPRITTKFYNFFGSTKHLPNFKIVYTYKHGYTFTLTLNDNKRLKPSFSPSLYAALSYGQIHALIKDVKKNLRQGDAFEKRAFRSAINNLETFVESLLGDSRTPVFIPAGRNITVNYPGQFQLDFYGKLVSNSDMFSRSKKSNSDSEEAAEASFSGAGQSIDLYLMMEFLKHTTMIQDRFKSTSLDGLLQDKQAGSQLGVPDGLKSISERISLILKGKYHHDQYGEKIYLDDDTYVHLNNASSGQQEAIRILQDAFLVVLDNESAFRVIEEPEAHLYPMAQKHLIEVLAIVLNQTNSQIIITTHSPYILSLVNNLLFASRVTEKNPNMADEVQQVIPSESWLDPGKTSVYFLKEGKSISIFDESLGLIDQNALDEISEELGSDFERLYSIHSGAFL